MRIHLTENPWRHTSCDIPKQTPITSLETVQEFSHMTATMADIRLDGLENFQPHSRGSVR